MPPSTSTVECLQVLSDEKWNGGPGFHGLVIKRTSFGGETIYEKTIEAPDPSHAFEGGFYDGSGLAYFLAVSTKFLLDKRAPPDCMLLNGFGQDTHVAARRPDVTDVTQCYRTEDQQSDQPDGRAVGHESNIKTPPAIRGNRRW